MLSEYGTSASDVKAEFIWMSPQVGASASFGGDDGLSGYMPLAVAANDNGAPLLTWVHANHMGVPAVYTNASGAAIAPPAGYSAPGFPGQSRTLGDLYYNRYRDYDPSTGRYIQADPIGLAGGASPYSYAMNNPLRYTDPTGEIVPLLVIGGAMIFRGVLGAGFNAGFQGFQLWQEGCDPFEWGNYDKSDIAISGVFGALIPGPGGAIWKNGRKWFELRKVAKNINRPLFEAAKGKFKKDAAFQTGRAAVGAGVKFGYDEFVEK